MPIVRTRLTGIFVFIAVFFLVMTTELLFFLLTFSVFLCFSVSIAVSSGVSTPSGYDSMRYAPPAFGFYFNGYRTYLDTEGFRAFPSHGDGKTVYDARNRLNRDMALGAGTHRSSH